MATLLLTQSQMRSLITAEGAVAAVEEAFAAHGRGETLMPTKVYLELAAYHGDFRAMPSYYAGAAGLKWVNAHPENLARHGLPTVRGIYLLSDPATAELLAVMDATWLTALRTGAAAAVASKHLARREIRSVGVIGCGVQARTMVTALRVVLSDFEIVAADRDAQVAQALVGELGGGVGTVEEAASCDIVCTATPSTRPIVERAWIRPGTHLNAMGADGHGKQELDPRILDDALVVVDDFEQAAASGEINVPLRQGRLALDDLHASLGQIVAGLKPGRALAEQITVFDSTGLAIQDLALARVIYRSARDRGAGRTLDFSA